MVWSLLLSYYKKLLFEVIVVRQSEEIQFFPKVILPSFL